LAVAVSGESFVTTKKTCDTEYQGFVVPLYISGCDNCVFNININSNNKE
jgi:hypothetical protein